MISKEMNIITFHISFANSDIKDYRLKQLTSYVLMKNHLIIMNSKTKIMKANTPNTACTRLVGVCAFSGSLCGLELILSERRSLVPPTSGYPVKITSDGPQTVRRLYKNP